jgi:hypothetical protein
MAHYSQQTNDAVNLEIYRVAAFGFCSVIQIYQLLLFYLVLFDVDNSYLKGFELFDRDLLSDRLFYFFKQFSNEILT